MFVGEDKIKTAIDKKSTGALALAIMIKATFANSVLYNYSPHRHAQLFGISTSLMQKNVAWLLKHGYADMQGKNLRIKRLWTRKSLRLPFTKKTVKVGTYRQNIDYIRLIYFKKHIDQQEYRIKKKESGQHLKHQPPSWRGHARALSHEEGVRETEPFNPDVIFSGSTISEILNISRGTTFSFIKRMETKNWLKRTNRHELIGQLTDKQFSYLRKAFSEFTFFRSKARNVYKAQANSYAIFELSPL